MKHVLSFLFVSIALVPSLAAQTTYTEKLRKSEPGKGTVVINQSSTIEKLVNNTVSRSVVLSQVSAGQSKQSSSDNNEVARTSDSVRRNQQDMPDTHSNSQHTLQSTGKNYVVRTRHKARGYRICIFTGGNSRNDKKKAIEMGNRCRRYFSELSVYTHFVAPRWVTYVGDFRTRNDAQKYVNSIRKSRISYEVRIVPSEVNLPD